MPSEFDSPCQSCELATVCRSAMLACRQYVAHFNNEADYAAQERRPNRLDYLLAHSEGLNVHELRERVADMKRQAKEAGETLTYSRIAISLGIDPDGVAELVQRYASKQGMRVTSVATDDRAMRYRGTSLEWVKLRRYCAASGETPASVHNKRRKGQWIDGVHCRTAPDGNLWVNLPAVQQWVLGLLPGRQSGKKSTKGNKR